MATFFDYFERKLEDNGLDLNFIFLTTNISFNPIMLNGEADPGETIVYYDFDIVYEDYIKETGPQVIGQCRCLYLPGSVHGGAKLVNLFRVADSHSSDLVRVVSPVLDEDGYLDIEPPPLKSDVVSIEHIHVDPEYQNKGIA